MFIWHREESIFFYSLHRTRNHFSCYLKNNLVSIIITVISLDDREDNKGRGRAFSMHALL